MVDWAEPFREDRWSAQLVDPFTLQVVGSVPIVAASCSVTSSADSSTGVTARIKLADGADYRSGAKSYMLRLTDDISLPSGAEYGNVLGTFFVDGADGEGKYGSVKRALSCFGSLWRHDQDSLVGDFYRSANSSTVAQAIQAVVEADGGHLVVASGVDTAKKFGNDIIFEMGTSKLEVIKTMASWIGCEVASGLDGSVVLRRALDSANLDPVYTFEAGKNCVYNPGITISSNRADIYNRVIYVYSSKDETARAVANLPATNQYSFDARGWHKTKVVKVSEMPEGGVQAAADAELARLSVETNDIGITHAGVPTVHVGDVVRYVNELDYGAPLDVIAQVIEQDVQSCGLGCKTQSKLRVVRW